MRLANHNHHEIVAPHTEVLYTDSRRSTEGILCNKVWNGDSNLSCRHGEPV